MSASIVSVAADAIYQAVVGAQSEIMAFMVAVMAHALFFGRYRINLPSVKTLDDVKPRAEPRSTSATKHPRHTQAQPMKARQVKVAVGEWFSDDAVATLQAMPEKSAAHYNSLLDAYVRSGNSAAAEKVMAESKVAGLADSATYNTHMKLHTQKGDLLRARQTVAEMRSEGLSPTNATYNELLNAAVQHDSAAVWPLLKEMERAGVKPNRITCSILLKSAQPASDPDCLAKVLTLVENLGDDMDEVLLGSLIEACMRYKQTQPLRRALRHARAWKHTAAKSGFLYGSIVRAYGFLRDVPGAWSAWRELLERGVEVTSVTIGCMVETLIQNGDLQGGYKLLREALEAPQTRLMVNAVIYCSVLKGFSHAGVYKRVWEIFEEMQREGVKPTIATFNALLDACARSHDMRRIPGLLEAMAEADVKPNVITYSTIIKAYTNEGLVDRALEVLAEMKANKDITPDELTYNTVINGCARQGACDQGLAILDEMCRSGVNPSNFTLSVLVKMAGRGRRLEKAFELCDELRAKFGLQPNTHVYNNLIAACLQMKKHARALEVLERMVKEQIRLDKRTYTLLLPAAQQPEEAVGLLRAAYGLRGAHPCLAAAPTVMVCPAGGIDTDVVVESLRAIAKGSPDGKHIAGQLYRDLVASPRFSAENKAFAQLDL